MRRILVAHPIHKPYGVAALLRTKDQKEKRVEKWFPDLGKRTKWLLERQAQTLEFALYDGHPGS